MHACDFRSLCCGFWFKNGTFRALQLKSRVWQRLCNLLQDHFTVNLYHIIKNLVFISQTLQIALPEMTEMEISIKMMHSHSIQCFVRFLTIFPLYVVVYSCNDTREWDSRKILIWQLFFCACIIGIRQWYEIEKQHDDL